MDAFCDRYGILKSWMAESAGIPLTTFNSALWEFGFRPQVVDQLCRTVNSRGAELLNFHFSDDSRQDLTFLRDRYGIKTNWLAAQLRVSGDSLRNFSQRQGGFRTDEKEVMELALRDIAHAMINFDVPSSLKKAA